MLQNRKLTPNALGDPLKLDLALRHGLPQLLPICRWRAQGILPAPDFEDTREIQRSAGGRGGLEFWDGEHVTRVQEVGAGVETGKEVSSCAWC